MQAVPLHQQSYHKPLPLSASINVASKRSEKLESLKRQLVQRRTQSSSGDFTRTRRSVTDEKGKLYRRNKVFDGYSNRAEQLLAELRKRNSSNTDENTDFSSEKNVQLAENGKYLEHPSADLCDTYPDKSFVRRYLRSLTDTSSSTELKTRTTSSTATGSVSNHWTEQKCPLCNRVYGSASIGIHVRACQRRFELHSKQLAAAWAWEKKMAQPPSHPPGTICYICGRRYTNASWRIHLPRCAKQWIMWNSLLPKRFRRKTPPITPEPTSDELMGRIDRAHKKGLVHYTKEDAMDDVMLEASIRYRLPLDLIN